MCKAFEDMRQEGYDEGMEKGMEKGIRILIEVYQELGMAQDDIREKCVEKYGITREDAGKYVRECCM